MFDRYKCLVVSEVTFVSFSSVLLLNGLQSHIVFDGVECKTLVAEDHLPSWVDHLATFF